MRLVLDHLNTGLQNNWHKKTEFLFQKLDAMLSEHVLALHSGPKSKRKDGASTSKLNTSIESSQADDDVSLR